MKKIACVGFHATGAGVIDDLLREFDNVSQGTYEVESRLLQDPDGISDLEYNLVENPHRLNSGFALKRYLQYVNKTSRSYKKIFGSRWEELSKKYVKSLVSFEFPGYWHGDVWLLNRFWQIVHMVRRGLAKISPKCIRKPSYYNYFPWLKSYHVNISREDFYKKTQHYIEQLCNEINKNNKEFVVLDQLISPVNPRRYINYVSDLKIIIVDRDPRDVYLHQINHKDHVLPTDIEKFCIEYRDDRQAISELQPDQCLYVTFEQMVLHYDEYVEKVLNFLGISKEHWRSPKTYFNPAKSSKNTRLWQQTDLYKIEIDYIEKELHDYLHDF